MMQRIDRSSAFRSQQSQMRETTVETKTSALDEVRSAGLAELQTIVRFGSQRALVSGVREGQFNRGEFLELSRFFRETERQSAQLRENGFTPEESQTLLERSEAYNKLEHQYRNEDVPRDEPVELDRLDEGLLRRFEALRDAEAGSPEQSRAETRLFVGLDVLADHAYTSGVEGRSGPVYTDERYRLRNGRALQRNIDGVRDRHPQKLPPTRPEDQVENRVEGQLILDSLDRNFEQLDADDNGQLDRLEMGALLREPESYGLEPEQAASLYAHQGLVGGIFEMKSENQKPVSSLSRNDLAPRGAMSKLADFALGNSQRRWRTQTLLGEDSVSLTSDDECGLFGPEGEPDPLSLRQNREGSCWLLAAVCQLEPAEVRKLIEQTPEGEFVVRFPGREAESVSALTEAERLVYSKGNGDWAPLLEKAAAQVFAREGRDINGDSHAAGIELVRGSKSESMFLDIAPPPGQTDFRDLDVLHQTLENSTEDKRIIMAGTYPSDFQPGISNIGVSGHAYAVLDYDPKTRQVTVRNPWGQNERVDRDDIDDGIFHMSLEDFQLNFTEMTIEEPKSR